MSIIGSVKTFPVTTAANADYRDTGIETGGSTYCSLKTIAPRKGRYFLLEFAFTHQKFVLKPSHPASYGIYIREMLSNTCSPNVCSRDTPVARIVDSAAAGGKLLLGGTAATSNVCSMREKEKQ